MSPRTLLSLLLLCAVSALVVVAAADVTPFPCNCGNATAATASTSAAPFSVGGPVSVPGDLTLHPWASYETVWYIGQVSTIPTAEAPVVRRFGVLYTLYATGSAQGMCPSGVGGVWAALAVPDAKPLNEGRIRRHSHHRRAPTTASSAPAPGAFLQDSRLLPAGMASSAQPFALWDAAHQWGLRQVASSTKAPEQQWMQMNFTASSSADGGFGYNLQLDASRIPVQAMAASGTMPGTCVQHRGQPRIAAKGTVSIGKETLLVAGTVWYQHMWGSPPAGAGLRWRWFNAELSDGWAAQFVFFDAPAEQVALSYGNLISPDGRNNTYIPAADMQLQQDPAATWISPHSGKAYNTSSTISVPSLGLQLQYRTWQADNEVLLTPGSNTAIFYEGVSDVWGTHRASAVTGNGYTERFQG